MPLLLVSGPASEPVTIAEVQAHLRLDSGNFEPAPDAPEATLAGAGAGNVDNGAHRYLATFVTASGETQAGAPSAAVTVVDNTADGAVTVSGIPVGGSSVIARKLYRTAAGGSTFLLHSTIADNTTTGITDNTADASLGAGAPSANTTGDPLLAMLIGASREYAETITRRALVTQQWKLALDRFPMPSMNLGGANWYGPQWGTSPGPLSAVDVSGRTGYEIVVPLPPLQTVDSIRYYDPEGVLRTLDPSAYIVDDISEPARITPAPNTTWPATQGRVNAVLVTFTCGYGAASAVPLGLKRWMLVRIGAMFENREEIVVDKRVAAVELPFVDRLLDPFRVLTF